MKIQKSVLIFMAAGMFAGCDNGSTADAPEESFFGYGGKADQACLESDAAHGETAGEVADATVGADDAWADEDGYSPEADGISGVDSEGLEDGVEEEPLADESGVEDLATETVSASPCGEGLDPFAEAYNVDQALIFLPEGTPAPASYVAPIGTDPFRLGGTEFWQKWSEGLNPTYSYYAGTEAGKRCMYASARRFEAIMKDPPPVLAQLREESNWSGSFFNWNDDYSQSTWGDGSKPRLWAWRTTLIKWISQTNLDGSCYLPTWEMVESLGLKCLARAQSNDGEIQGCTN